MLTDSNIFEMALAHGACWPDESECELSRAQLVAFARSIEAAERERWNAALALPHYYGGDCPDPDQPNARDPVNCAACRALVELEA